MSKPSVRRDRGKVKRAPATPAVQSESVQVQVSAGARKVAALRAKKKPIATMRINGGPPQQLNEEQLAEVCTAIGQAAAGGTGFVPSSELEEAQTRRRELELSKANAEATVIRLTRDLEEEKARTEAAKTTIELARREALAFDEPLLAVYRLVGELPTLDDQEDVRMAHLSSLMTEVNHVHQVIAAVRFDLEGGAHVPKAATP